MASTQSTQNDKIKVAIRIVSLFALIGCACVTNAQTFTVLHTFTGGDDGGYPGSVAIDAAGNLYGNAAFGAVHDAYCLQYGCGTVYKLSHHGSDWTLSVLHTFFGNSDGAGPGGVTLARDGTLYGTSVGVSPYVRVFHLQPPASACRSVSCAWTFTVLYSFNSLDNNGAVPTGAPLALDSAGNLYGVTQGGGNGGCNNNSSTCGTVFELSPSGGTWNLNFIHLFSGTDGANPSADSGVILDPFGNVYGTTTYGGPTRNYGTVFQIAHSGSGWQGNVIYAFSHDNDDQGRYPSAGVVMDSAGNLYGTNTVGGPLNHGVAFGLSYSAGWNLSVLYSFTTQMGAGGTYSPLTLGPDGSLYGVSPFAGQYSMGVIYKLTNNGGTWTYTSLHDFMGQEDGANPYDSVVFDAQGNLYGTANGGAHDEGVVFQITP
jgi:hypothetical protein